MNIFKWYELTTLNFSLLTRSYQTTAACISFSINSPLIFRSQFLKMFYFSIDKFCPYECMAQQLVNKKAT